VTSPTEPTISFIAESRWKIVLAGAVIVLAALAAYHNSFSGAFVFDDPQSIIENATIRPPWSIAALLSPPAQATVAGRPLVNLSLALNYAMGGTDVWGYHAVNLVIHMLAGLALFGVIRRTLVGLGGAQTCRAVVVGRSLATDDRPQAGFLRLRSDATLLALAVALLWTVHPLQTESVTYTVQRTESLMGLFYLLTLYYFIRGVEEQEGVGGSSTTSGHALPDGMACHERRSKSGVEWFVLSVAACLLGMASKEVMVSAPVMVLLYDRTFLAGTFREAWRRRRRPYLGLAATWLLLGCLVASVGGNRGGTSGMGSGATPGAYVLTQFPAVVNYLWLSVWPHPLVFDYGAEWVKDAVDVVPAALLVVGSMAGTLFALKRWPVLGFLGVWFFAILAPTSLVPGPRQTIAEHRMYLAVAAIISLLVFVVHASSGRRTLVAWFALALGLGWLTVSRNEDYRTELSIWGDTAAKRPRNPWVQTNLGMALYDQGKAAESMRYFERSLKLGIDDAGPHNNLGLALAKLGRGPEALSQYEAALRLRPAFPEAHNNLGLLLSEMNRPAEALSHLETALRLKPGLATVHFNLGNTLAQMGRMEEAIARYEQAIRMNLKDAAAYTNLANVLVRIGRPSEGIRRYEMAARLDPNDAMAQYNLAMVLAQIGRTSDAIVHFQEAVRLRPDDTEARNYLRQLQALQPGARAGP
jgi:protein O-mannosyl-transferase